MQALFFETCIVSSVEDPAFWNKGKDEDIGSKQEGKRFPWRLKKYVLSRISKTVWNHSSYMWLEKAYFSAIKDPIDRKPFMHQGGR